jgi:integrase
MELTFKLEQPSRQRSPIAARVYHNKRRHKFSTGISVPTEIWRKDNSGVNTSPKLFTNLKMTPLTAANINTELEKLKRQFARAWGDELKRDDFDIERVIHAATTARPVAKEKAKTLNETISAYIQFAEKNPIGSKGNPASPNTLKTYRSSLRRIEAYQADKKVTLYPTDVNQDFYIDLIEYMTKLEYKITYTSKVLDPVKKALKWAHQSGTDIHNDILFNRLKKYRSDSYLHPTMSIEELRHLASLKLTGSIEKTRDLLIIGCWTALRVSDLMKITKVKVHKDEQGGYIQVESTKVKGTYIEVPLHPQVKAIRERWKGWPPVFNEQDFNRRLKKLGQLADMNEVMYGEIIKKKKVNGEDVMRTTKGNFKKWELLSSHCCRRSFATNLYGVLETGDIMQVTGHSSEATFRKYIHQKPIESRRRIRSAIDSL